MPFSRCTPRAFRVGLLLSVSLLSPAQQPNSPQATLLVDGQTAALTRVRGQNLVFTLRGAPGAPVLLGEGTATPPTPVPSLGGSIEGVPYAFRLNGFDPGFPLYYGSILGPLTGELTWNLRFDPPAGVTSVVFQALVSDPGGTPSGLRLTASVAVALVAAPPVPTFAPWITRGPYIEQTGTTSTMITTRLDAAAPLSVDLGPDGVSWPTTFSAPGPATEHVLTLSGLAPATRYRYRVRSGVTTLAEGEGFAFSTAPPPGSQTPFRFVAWGDSGNGQTTQARVSQRLEEIEPKPDFALILGDIIYPGGEAASYDPNFFLPYRGMLASMTIWPALGNHDVVENAGAAYFANFHLPTTTSGTEKYYSFDWGDAHFVALDSQTSVYAGSPMLTWAAADLAATTRTWKIVFFHHPPYSGGTHSDDLNVQALLIPILDAAGVDVVLNGHSHVLERSYLLQNHSILQNAPNDYAKVASPDGAVYVVAGAGGQLGPLSNASHPLMAFQVGATLGHAVIEIEGANLRGYFLDDAGNHLDRFSITKGADVTQPVVTGARGGSSPNQVVVVFDEPVEAGGGPGGAANPANYALDGAATPTAAVLGGDTRTVTLTFATAAFGVPHSLAVSNVRDRASPANVVAPTTLPLKLEPWRRVVLPGGHWHLLEGSAPPPSGWADRDFDDSGWIEGHAPIGYGNGAVSTTLPMLNSYLTFYARADFEVDDPSAVAGMRFEANFDDGIVAYLNGVEIARRGVPTGQTNTTTAPNHPSGSWERYLSPQALRYLQPGVNVLAVEVHNTGLTSSDCFFDGALSLRGASFGPGLRLSANGVTGPDHGVAATVSTSGLLTMLVEGGPAAANRAVQFSVGALRNDLGIGAALLPSEFPFFAITSDPLGYAVATAGLPASLSGIVITVQAFVSAPFAASNAVTITFGP